MRPDAEDVACLVCGQDADRLCDYILGRDIDKVSRDVLVHGKIESCDEPHFTCDAPLCSECRAVGGHMHGVEKGEGWSETTDLCPAHKDLGLGTLLPLVRAIDVRAFRSRLAMAVIGGVSSIRFEVERPDRGPL